MAPTWNDESELSDCSYSVSDIQDYIECIIKNHETLTTITPLQGHINKINNRLVFTLKETYKLEFVFENGRPFKIEDKVNLTLLINKQKWPIILYNQKQENMFKNMNFYHSQEGMKNKYWIKR